MSKVYIFGHQRPDTDAVTAAITLSHLKRELGLDTEEEEVIEEKHETINTDMYDEGYEFRSDITPEFLNNLNL